ncbi:hypothetical protein C2845_PM02G32900 [Panicum miliaceum]|uniref:Uncharacterized protein n=1 Tax=Panicum miliaceum TaxID=4540 RepID=A0A3L6S505_PANMI|nr:hypothetical protein C2845_PM02G32900 [Panicum miliaceum]
MRQQRNESTSSLVSTQIMHVPILYAKLMKVCAGISRALDVPEQALSARQLWRNSEETLLWVGAISCYGLQQFPEIATTRISLHGMGDSRVEMFPQVDFYSVELHDSNQCQRQKNTSDLQLGSTYARKPLIIFVAMDWEHDKYLINLIGAKLQCKMTKNLSNSSSAHLRWCNNSIMEMVRPLRSYRGSVQVVISTGAQAAWSDLFADSHRRSTISNFYGIPVVAACGQATFQAVGNVMDRPSQERLPGGPGYENG